MLGKELEFSIGFAKGTYDLKQWSFVSEIEHTWSQSCNVMADETFDAYTTVRGDTVAFTVNKGDVVQYDKIWLSDGLIWEPGGLCTNNYRKEMEEMRLSAARYVWWRVKGVSCMFRLIRKY